MYSPSPEENRLPDNYHEQARVIILNNSIPNAVNAAVNMFRVTPEQLLNPPQLVVTSTTPNTAPNSTTDTYNQNYHDTNPVNPSTTNAKVGYITVEEARARVERASTIQ